MAPLSKIYSSVCRQEFCRRILERMAGSSDGCLALNVVFSPDLNPEKHWYALNSTLCGCKASIFCSTVSAKTFADEYKHVSLEDLRGEDGAQASFRWFCSHRSSEKVYVASAFSLLLGILRLKTWSNCEFIKSEYFKSAVSLLNSRGFGGVEDASGKLAHSQSQVTAQNSDLPTPPATPSQPKSRSPPNCESPPFCQSPPNCESPPFCQSPPNCESPPFCDSPPTQSLNNPWKKKKSIAQLKVDDDLSPSSKRKKVRQAAAAVMKSVTQLCENEWEKLGTILGECCVMKGNDGLVARETVKAVFDEVVKEKGTKEAFEKLLSEETWDKRVQCMRVPDWIYLLFKLKARISDSGWQALTNLTKLARTGVSVHRFCLPSFYLRSGRDGGGVEGGVVKVGYLHLKSFWR